MDEYPSDITIIAQSAKPTTSLQKALEDENLTSIALAPW